MRGLLRVAIAVGVVGIVFLMPSNAAAITTSSSADQVVPINPPMMITAYSFTNSYLHYVQLYNNDDNSIMSLDGWNLEFTAGDGQKSALTPLHGLVAPETYVVAANPSVVANPTYILQSSTSFSTTLKLASIRLIPPANSGYLVQEQVIASLTANGSFCDNLASGKAAPYHAERTRSVSTGSYNTSASSFCYQSLTPSYVLYMDPLYEFVETPRPEITEIVANSRNCAPSDTALDCEDYVKFYNPTDQPMDLSAFRLRNGYLGQIPSTSNTTELSGIIAPGHYGIISTNVTNTGSWLWLEDIYGAQRYDETIVEYPDASADSKKGQAWAYDESDGLWKWTIQPTPYDNPSVFPQPPPDPVKISTSSLTPCREDQYRSEETNRCRSLLSALSTSLTPCKEGQYRSEETNRCRSVLSAVADLVPCKEGQERSPTTNRCRNIINTDVPKAAFAVEPIKDTSKAFVGWWALGGVGALALGYAGWEWRREVVAGIQKVRTFFISSK